jgi:hypothetical protein
MNARAFGERAERVAARVPELDAMFAQLDTLDTAYPEAVRMRREGCLFYGMVLWEDPRARIAFDLAPALLAQFSTLDERRSVFDSLAAGDLNVNGRSVRDLWAIDPTTAQRAREFINLATGQLFWSASERERFAQLFGRRRAVCETLTAPHRLPEFTSAIPRRTRVVIWAPELPAAATALLAFAFEEWRDEVFVVCAEGDVPSVRAQYIDAGDAQAVEILSGAALVVDASLSDPGAALAFAQRNVPLLIASTSGAQEYVRDAVVYEPSQWRTVYSGALRACGRASELRDAHPVIPPSLRVSARHWSKDPPLVSIVVPTYNRPDELAEALEAFAAQTYPNVQVVVVNDGGVSVADVCARFPHVNIKLLDRKENVKPVAAFNVGFRAADGKYVCTCPDDDRFFPDHVERLVDALECGGAMIAHSNCLAHYIRIDSEGRKIDVGYNASTYVDEIDPSAALVATSVNMISAMVRKDLYERLGYWDAKTDYADYDIQLRMSLCGVFLHVDHFTNAWTVREDASNFSASLTGESAFAALRYIFDKHPIDDRPLVEQARRSVEETVRRRTPGMKYLFPPTFTLK